MIHFCETLWIFSWIMTLYSPNSSSLNPVEVWGSSGQIRKEGSVWPQLPSVCSRVPLTPERLDKSSKQIFLCHFNSMSYCISKKVPSWETWGKERGGSSEFCYEPKSSIRGSSSESLFDKFAQRSTLTVWNRISSPPPAPATSVQSVSWKSGGDKYRENVRMIICWRFSCD